MPVPLQDATVRVRLALLDGVLDHFSTTGGFWWRWSNSVDR